MAGSICSNCEQKIFRRAKSKNSLTEALAIMKTFRPDVIVLDLMMPVMDGWQFATELRARDEDIPIVLLSAARDLRMHAKNLSAAEIIEKPFDLSELLPKIAKVASAA